MRTDHGKTHASWIKSTPPELDTQGMRIRRLIHKKYGNHDTAQSARNVAKQAKIPENVFQRAITDYLRADKQAPSRLSEPAMRRLCKVLGCTWKEIYVAPEPTKFTLKNVIYSHKLLEAFIGAPLPKPSYRKWIQDSLRIIYVETELRKKRLNSQAERAANAAYEPQAKQIITERHNLSPKQLDDLLRKGFTQWRQILDDTVYELRFEQ